jgi:hypothetical protein
MDGEWEAPMIDNPEFKVKKTKYLIWLFSLNYF